MKSTDGGAHWFEITTGLNIDQEFYKIIVDKRDPDILYLATQGEGVFISCNGGASWLSWNEGLTDLVAGTNGNNVANMMVCSADGNFLYFGSAGSGVFKRMTVTALTSSTSVNIPFLVSYVSLNFLIVLVITERRRKNIIIPPTYGIDNR